MKRLQNRGFTLVEVIVAFVILGIAGGTILNSFAMAVRLNAKAEQEFQAAGCARTAMEYVLHLDGLKTEVVDWASNSENLALLLSEPDFYELKTTEPYDALVLSAAAFTGAEDILDGFDGLIPSVKSVALQKADSEEAPDSAVVCRIQIELMDGTEVAAELTGSRRIEINSSGGGSGGGGT